MSITTATKTHPITRQDAAEASTSTSPKATKVFVDLINTVDAAAKLGISKRSLQELVANRKIGSIKFGRNIRFAIEDIEKFIESHRVLPVGWKHSGKKGLVA